MNDNIVIKIPSKKKILIYTQVIYVCFMLWLRDVVGLPSAILYLTDIITVLIIFLQFRDIIKGLKTSTIGPQIWIFGLIVAFMLLGAVVNLVNPMLVMWGLRNHIRFFVFFFLCIALLSKRDIEKLVEMFKVYFWLNVVMMTFQHFVQGYCDDFLGGFFGVLSGCNAYVCIMLCLITAIVLAEFNSSKVEIGTLLIYCLACIYIATLSELKIYFLEIVLIAAVQLLYIKPSKKTVGICITVCVILIAGFSLVKRYNPIILNVFLDSDAREYYLSGNGYTNSGDLNRLSAIQELYAKFFKGDRLHTLLGFGLGSGDSSSFSFLQSAFYKKYEYLHYRWFTHAWVFLEQGSIGIILLIAFFISIAVFIMRTKRKNRTIYDLIVFSFLPTCVIGIIYNNSLELESCYLIALVCAVPFIMHKKIICRVSEQTFNAIKDLVKNGTVKVM